VRTLIQQTCDGRCPTGHRGISTRGNRADDTQRNSRLDRPKDGGLRGGECHGWSIGPHARLDHRCPIAVATWVLP